MQLTSRTWNHRLGLLLGLIIAGCARGVADLSFDAAASPVGEGDAATPAPEQDATGDGAVEDAEPPPEADADASGSLDGGDAEGAEVAPLDASQRAPLDASQDAGDAGEAPGDSGDAARDAAVGPPDLQCAPGTYIGEFGGTITWLFLSFPVRGQIEITVDTATTGDRLVLENGRIEGADDTGNPVTADVVGVFNCVTNELEAGRLENGLYVREGYGEVRFQGTVTAAYTPSNPPAVHGLWETVQTGFSLESAQGNWSATWVRGI